MANEYRFVDLVDIFPPLILRTQVKDYFPFFSPKRMANLDSIGKGPPSLRVGERVVYPTKDFLAWLDARNGQKEQKQDSDTGIHGPDESPRPEGGGKVSSKISKRGRKPKLQEVRERRGLD